MVAASRIPTMNYLDWVATAVIEIARVMFADRVDRPGYYIQTSILFSPTIPYLKGCINR